MASKYYRGKHPNGSWWLQFYHPRDGSMRRFPLKTGDDAHAEVIRKMFELNLALARPEFADVEVPAEILADVGIEPVGEKLEIASITVAQPLPTPQKPRLTTVEAVRLYLGHIRAENADHHVASKISILRQFFGSEMLPYRRAPKDKSDELPPFQGQFIDEVDVTSVKQFINGKDITTKSRRHYREVFHDFFQMLHDDGLIKPIDFSNPNRMHGLGQYSEAGEQTITFLTPEDKVAQEAALQSSPSLLAAYMLMTEAGLRRSEALWLRRDSLAADLSYLSVANKVDPESGVKSRLKTKRSRRSVSILPRLKAFLEAYLPTLKGVWLVPSPTGKRWNADNFSAALRLANENVGIGWSAMDYRHTYATERAGEGWTMFDLAGEMGTSLLMIENNYAAYLKPSRLTRGHQH